MSASYSVTFQAGWHFKDFIKYLSIHVDAIPSFYMLIKDVCKYYKLCYVTRKVKSTKDSRKTPYTALKVIYANSITNRELKFIKFNFFLTF